MIEIRDLRFEKYISEKEINKVVEKLAKEVEKAYQGKDLVVMGVLNGAFMFTSDLVKKMSSDPEILFVKYKSYKGTKTSGVVYKELEPELDLSGRHVLVVEDVVDSGNTLEQIVTDLKKAGLASLAICTLLYKKQRYKKDISIDFVGMEIPNDFVIGYGMDYEGLGRSLTDLYKFVAS